MSEILVQIKDVYHQKDHTILINENSVIQSFLDQVISYWNIDYAEFDHQLYSKDSQMLLDSSLSWKDNKVVNGDQILLF